MSLTHSTGINANGKGGEETEANIMPQTLENINLLSSNDQQQQRQNQSVTLLASSDKESEDLYRISQRMEQFEEVSIIKSYYHYHVITTYSTKFSKNIHFINTDLGK